MPYEQTMYLLQLEGSLNDPSMVQAKVDLIVVVEVWVEGALVVVTGVVVARIVEKMVVDLVVLEVTRVVEEMVVDSVVEVLFEIPG